MAPIFFQNNDPVVGLILTYGLMSTGIVTKPIGAFLFGKLAAQHGAKRILIVTLIGVATSSFCIGLLPGYKDIGYFAPLLLMIIRMLQNLFSSGETAISTFFILEQAPQDRRYEANGYYLLSTMCGSILASIAATVIAVSDNHETYWRLPFYISALTGVVCVFIRLGDNKIESNRNDINHSSILCIANNKLRLLQVACISGFSFITYSIPFIFMNKFVPMISDISDTSMLKYNNILLIIDVLLIPVFTVVIKRLCQRKWMALMSFLIAITIVPIFYLLRYSSIYTVTLLKLWIIVIGVGFSVAINMWLFNLLRNKERYIIMGVGYNIGVELLGRNCVAICWILFYKFDNILAPAVYIAILSILTTLILLFTNNTEDTTSDHYSN